MPGIFTFVNTQPGLMTEPGIKLIVTTLSALGESTQKQGVVLLLSLHGTCVKFRVYKGRKWLKYICLFISMKRLC